MVNQPNETAYWETGQINGLVIMAKHGLPSGEAWLMGDHLMNDESLQPLINEGE